MSECNAGVEGSSGGSLKGEEEEPRAQETMSLDGDSSAGNTRHTAALEAQGADSGSDDELNLGATPALTDYIEASSPQTQGSTAPLKRNLHHRTLDRSRAPLAQR